MKNIEARSLEEAKKLGVESSETDFEIIDTGLNCMKKGRVAKIWDKVLFLWEKAKSPEVPMRLKLTIIGALLYLILPTDVVPDTIPGIGLVDDVSVLLLVFNEVSKFAIPKAVKQITVRVEESYFPKIDASLKHIFAMMLKSSIITLVVNVIGILMFVFRPFDEYSKFVGFALFGCTFVFLIVRIVLYLKQYGKITLTITRTVFKNKSLSKGISEFVKQQYPVITNIYAGIGVAKKYIPGTDSIPDFDKIVKDFIIHYRRKVLLVLSLFSFYSVSIFVLKVFVIK